MQLVREASSSTPSLMCFSDTEEDEAASRADTLVRSLEKAAGDAGRPGEEQVGETLRSGFWRLTLVSEPATAKGGLTGYGDAPFCSVLGSFQAFIDLKGTTVARHGEPGR